MKAPLTRESKRKRKILTDSPSRITNFKLVKKQISQMSDEEKEIAFSYLNCFDVAFGKTETKLSILFRYLVTHPDVLVGIAQERFGLRANTFEVSIKRLSYKLGRINGLEVNYLRAEVHPKGSVAYFIMLDNLKEIYDLIGKRSIPTLALRLIYANLRLGKTYEIYSLLIETMEFLLNYETARKPTKDFSALEKEIDHYEDCRIMVKYAKRSYNKYKQFAGADGLRLGFAQEFSPILRKLAKYHVKANSVQVSYFYYIIKLGYLQETGDIKLAKDYANKILNLVLNNPGIYTKLKVGNAHMHVADTYLYCRSFSAAIEAARAAQNYYPKDSWNYSLSEEVEFFGRFYLNDFIKAEKKISSILKNRNYKQSVFRDDKRQYYHANTLFALGKFDECLKVLETTKEISSVKNEWYLWVRFLSVMVSISQNDIDSAFHKVDALRKQIDNLKFLNKIRDREVYIYRILRELVKKKLNFVEASRSRSNELIALKSEESHLCWKVKSPEFIIFHIWFVCMLRGETYKV